MKKILALILMMLMVIVLSGCNYKLVDLKYNFKKVHVCEAGKCYEIKNWRDYEDGDQLQVTLEDGTVLLLHSTDCALVHGDCVLCKDKEK